MAGWWGWFDAGGGGGAGEVAGAGGGQHTGGRGVDAFTAAAARAGQPDPVGGLAGLGAGGPVPRVAALAGREGEADDPAEFVTGDAARLGHLRGASAQHQELRGRWLLGGGVAQTEVWIPLLGDLGGQRGRRDEDADIEFLVTDRAPALAGATDDPIHGHVDGGRREVASGLAAAPFLNSSTW